MRAEEFNRLLRESVRTIGGERSEWTLTLSEAHLKAFARACEQHGIERAVAALQATVADSYTDRLARLTRERVTAEIAKENEDG